MDNNNPIYYRDLIVPDDSITKLITQLEQLIGVYDSAQKKIQGSAQQTAQSLQGVSGAVDEQRKAITVASEETQKLVERYKNVSTALDESKQAHIALTQAKKEANQLDKLIVERNNAAEGSYKRLSAEYRIAKIRLNEMSAAERTGTEEGQKLEAQAAQLYQQMNELQKATGKYTLQVGNYEIATTSLRQELMDLTMQLAQMRLAGEQGSEAYNELSKKAGLLKDAFTDAQREIKNMASDTKNLSSIASGASAVSGGMMALQNSLKLVGSESNEASEAQKKLSAAVGIVSGAMLIQNALQKQSALMLGIRTIQTWAATKAEEAKAKAIAKSTAAEVTQTTATKGATVAQRIFNLVASANPYVLLAIAITTVVGALVAFSLGSNKAAKAMREQNELVRIQIELMEKLEASYLRTYDTSIRKIQEEINLRRAQGAGQSELDALEAKLFAAKMKRWAFLEQAHKKDIENLEENEKKLRELQIMYGQLQELQARGEKYTKIDWDMDGKMETWRIDKLMEEIQSSIDNYGKKINIAYDIKEGKEKEQAAEKERQAAAAKAGAEAAKARAKAELDAIRAMQDAELALMLDGYEKELTQLRRASARQVEDLQLRLKQEKNLTTKAREAIGLQILAIQEKLKKDEAALNERYALQELNARRATEDLLLGLMEEGAEKERKALQISYTRQINDLMQQIQQGKNLTAKQIKELLKQVQLLEQKYAKDSEKLNAKIAVDGLTKSKEAISLRLEAVQKGSQEEIDLTVARMNTERQIEIAENRQLAEDKRQDEAAINAKWDAKILKTSRDMTYKRAEMLYNQQEDLAASEFDLTQTNERQKTKFALEQQAARIRFILANDKTLTEEQIKMYENMLKKIEQETQRLKYSNLWEVLGIGLDSGQQEALDTAIDSIKDSIGSLIDSYNQAAEAAVESADKQVDAAQKILDAEIEARANGYANNVEQAQKELALAQRTKEQALRQEQKAQKAQQAIDTATQASSLITASANLWASLSSIPYVGYALAIAAIASMWLSFGAAKIKAWQVAGSGKEEYGEGTVELLEGGSHASGNDIDLGTKKDGTRRRAEGGEFFAVINKRNSAKYRSVIPDVINAFNNGTFGDKYQRANAAMAGVAVGMIGTDVSGLEKDVRKIREQGDNTQFVDGRGTLILRYKNLTRRIKS